MRAHETLAVYVMFVFTAVCVGAWAVVMCTQEWVRKMTPYYNIEAGLFQVELKQGLISKVFGSVLENITPAGKEWLGKLQYKQFALDEFKEYMCALPKVPGWTGNLCHIWQWVQVSSWGLLFCVVFSNLMLLTAAGGLYWYAFVRPRTVLRMWLKTAYFLVPCLQICSVAAYAFASWQVEEMFPRVSGSSVGTSVMLAGACALLSAFPGFIMVAMLGKMSEEAKNEALSEQKKFMRESPELYGSTGGAPQDCAAPGYEQPPAAEAYYFQQQQPAQPWQTGAAHAGTAYGAPFMGSASGGQAPAVHGFAEQAAYDSQPGYSPVQPNAWESQPAELRKGVSYMPDRPPAYAQA